MKDNKEPKPQKTRTPIKSTTHPELEGFTNKLITARRFLAELKQEQLAEILSVEIGVIQRLEKNRGSVENFLRLLQFMHKNINLDMNSLFDDSPEPKLLPKQNSDDDFNIMEHAISL